MQLQLNILTLQNWLDFALRLCLSIVTAWCAHLDSRCQRLRVQWRGSCPQQTTGPLPWKLNLYHKIDGDPSEISRRRTSSFATLAASFIDDDTLASLAHSQIVHMFITKSSVLLEYTKLQLGCIDCYCYFACMWASSCMQSSMVNSCAWGPRNQHRGISMLVLLMLISMQPAMRDLFFSGLWIASKSHRDEHTMP